MKNELQVKVNNQLGKINFNYEEIRENLAEMMEIYKEAEVTADTVSVSKKDIATLRKIKKALNDRRIGIKKEYMAPYDDFETKVKELTALIDEPIVLIGEQVKEFEEKERLEKVEKIKSIYAKEIGELEKYIPLHRIYNASWENKSTSLKSIQDEMCELISSTQMSIDTIKGMSSEIESKVLEQFRDDLSLANAITSINKHEQLKAEILAREQVKRKEEEERNRRLEEERIRQQERQKVIDEENIRREARERAVEEERQRVAEEEARKKALEEEKQSELEKIREEDVEIIDSEKGAPFSFGEEEPFLFEEEPFDTDEGQPFTKKAIIIEGTHEELEQIELLLIRNKVNYRLEEI